MAEKKQSSTTGKLALMINASSDRKRHFTVAFLSDVKEANVDAIKKLYEATVIQTITPTTTTNKYECTLEKTVMWGRNSINVAGGIVKFKTAIETAFKKAPELGSLSIRQPHVDVGGDPECKLLPVLDLMDYTTQFTPNK